MEHDDDVRGVAVHRLADRIVEDLPDQVVQASGADAPDIHAGPLADGLQPLENGDVFRGVGGHEWSQAEATEVTEKSFSTTEERR